MLSTRDTQPQSTAQDAPRTIISPPIQITTSSAIATHARNVTEVTQSMPNPILATIQSKIPHPERYSPVYKMSQTHIEELNFRLQGLTERHIARNDNGNVDAVDQAVLSGDINPSVGSDNEKESDLNIQQLESSVSSLSGLPTGSSTINSPEAVHVQRYQAEKNWRVERYETDF